MFPKLELPRPDERRAVAGAFLLLFGILAGHTLLETARDALFLAKLPVRHLPWVYMAIAVLSVGAVPGRGRGTRSSPQRALAGILIGASLFTLALWLVTMMSTDNWTFYVLYVWTGIFGTVALLQFWLLMGEAYTVTQAKRLFGMIGSGSILGAITGAGLAWLLVETAPVRSLILTAAGLFFTCGLGCALWRPRRKKSRALAAQRNPDTETRPVEIGQFAEAFRALRGNAYFRRLLRLILLATVAVTMSDYVFKTVVDANVAPENLGAFFAKLYVGLNAIALVVQVLLVGWILRVIGVHRSQWFLPICLAVASGWLLTGAGLGAALLLKGADGGLRHSLHRTSTELLYLPLKDSERKFFKPLIDVLGQRGGQALASLGILGTVILGINEAWIMVAIAFVCLWWMRTAHKLEEPYFELFRENLRTNALDTRGQAPELDLGSLEAIFSAFNSRDDAEVLAALDLLAEQRRVRLIPALVLYHPSTAVVLRALELFVHEGRNDFVPVADRILAHPDPEIRAAALRARQAIAPDDAVLRIALRDDIPLVRATALVGLLHEGAIGAEQSGVFEQIITTGTDDEREALARAIGDNPRPAFASILVRLGETGNVKLLRVIARAMGAVRSVEFLPVLVTMIARRELRDDARQALLAYGKDGLRFLAQALADVRVPLPVRRHLPRTISRFEPHAASAILVARLLDEPDGVVRFKILRGLGRLRSDNPRLALDEHVLGEATSRDLERVFRLIAWRIALQNGAETDARRRTQGHELLVTMLRDKEQHGIERVFRLLGLMHPTEDFERLWRGTHSADAKQRASSNELLANALADPWRDPVLAIISDGGDAERLMRAGRDLALPAYGDVLDALLGAKGESLRCFAAYHVGELGMTGMRPKLQAVLASAPGRVSQVVQQALEMLAVRAAEPAHG